jgi:DNA-binding beta-propeller fold protein YncE
VLDLESFSVVRSVPVPPAPQEILVRPDGRVAYVSCDRSGLVAELDLATWSIVRTIETGAQADGLAWASPRP